MSQISKTVSTNPIAVGSISVSVETLPASNYSDLIKVRRPGSKFKASPVSMDYKDVLVLPYFADGFDVLVAAIDRKLRGLIGDQILERRFMGRQGETLVVELESRGFPSCNPRRIVLVGLGDKDNYDQMVYCGLTATIMNVVTSLDAERVVLPLAALSSLKLMYGALAAVLRCRIEHHLATVVEHGRLQSIRLLVGEGLKDVVEQGLAPRKPLCAVCSNPEI